MEFIVVLLLLVVATSAQYPGLYFKTVRNCERVCRDYCANTNRAYVSCKIPEGSVAKALCACRKN
uniref:Toxin-like peptide n=1 Tax=Pandinus cavimanus TaxID=217261 RepID=H2CYQ3_PANCV|nr:toxin-like peptide [Pandinus cavimanus]AEX09226.1 toxin-like peptide [Pandinus cavimanus]